MAIEDLNEMLSNLIVEQCFWNLTNSLADLKVILDEVVNGNDLEWNHVQVLHSLAPWAKQIFQSPCGVSPAQDGARTEKHDKGLYG